MQSSTWIRNEQ